MAFRYLKRTRVPDLEGGEHDYAPDPSVPAVGLSNFRGVLHRGDVVGVVVASQTPVRASFEVSSCLLRDGADFQPSGSGRYYPSEEHFFRISEEPHPRDKHVVVEPLFLTPENGVVHCEADECFFRDVAIPLEACRPHELFNRLVRFSPPPPPSWGVTAQWVRRELAKRHEPTDWFTPNDSAKSALYNAVRDGRKLRVRGRVEASATRESQLRALKASLRQCLYYVDYRETLHLDPSSTRLQTYVQFVHSHPRELAHVLDLDEVSGELAALLEWIGTMAHISHRYHAELPALVHDIMNGRQVVERCRHRLNRPAFVGPAAIALNVGKLQRRHVYRVLRADPRHGLRTRDVVTNWGGTPLDECVLTMLSAGHLVRFAAVVDDGRHLRFYCRLLMPLGPHHFLAVIELLYICPSEKTVFVLDTRAIVEVPFRLRGNTSLRAAYRDFLLRTLAQRRLANGDDDVNAETFIDAHNLEVLSEDEDEGFAEVPLVLDVAGREDAGVRIPLTYEPLFHLWGIGSAPSS